MVNIVAGAGEVGARIVADERVACVAFTGSVATGKKVAMTCAERVARVNLEMGGKDAVHRLLRRRRRARGRREGRRLGRVPERRARSARRPSASTSHVRRLRRLPRSSSPTTPASLVVGDPMDPATDVGPMVSAEQRGKVAAQVEAAVDAGAELVVGGGDAGHERGHFFSPAVVTGAPADTALLSEETFGPVAPIVPVGSLDEAIELANSTPYGLGANVYTRDLANTVRCLRELKAGTVWFNDPLTDNDAGPFGGFKQSGLGRELGREGLEAFQETKHVHIETEIAAKDWWYPYAEGGERPPEGAGA